MRFLPRFTNDGSANAPRLRVYLNLDTLVPKIFPNGVCGAAMTVPVLLQWLANAAVILLFRFVFHRAGKTVTFGFFALMALAQSVFTLFCVPETKNMSLEDVEMNWTGARLERTIEAARRNCSE